jgi:hypothetical protein
MSDSGSGSDDADPIHGTRLWRAVRAGDVTEITKALPSVRGVDGGGRNAYEASSPDRSAGGRPQRGAIPSGGGGGDAATRLPGWRPVSLAECDADGQTALHLAARLGNAAVVALLLERGAELNGQDAAGRTPFVEAAKHGAAAVAAVLVAAALRNERAARGTSEDLEQMLDREARDALLGMMHGAADAGDVVGVRAGLEAVATLVGKAIRVGDTMYIEKILGAGLEVGLSGAAALARRHSQDAMAEFLEGLEAARAPTQPPARPVAEESGEAGQDADEDGLADDDEEEDDDEEGGEPEPAENKPPSVAERLAQGELRLLERALLETDLAKIDQILATHRESFRSVPVGAAVAGGRLAVREAWQRLRRRRRELQTEQRKLRDSAAAPPDEEDDVEHSQQKRQEEHLCGICRESLRPPACQCAKGHVFCGECLKDSLQRIPECPIW